MMKVLSQIGFRWHQNGAILRVVVDGQRQDVFVPLNRLTIEFGDALANVGCPLLPAVGWEPYSVGGLFSRIKRAYKRAKRVATAPQRAVIRRVVPKAIRRRAAALKSRAVNYARRVKRFVQTSPYARYGAMAMTAFPATAPAGAALMAAQRTMAVIEKGRRAARLVKRGIQRPSEIRAMAAAQAQQQGVAQLGQLARQGNPQAQQFFGALQQFAR